MKSQTSGPRRAIRRLLTLIPLAFSLQTAGCDTTSVFRTPDPSVRYIAFGDSTTDGPTERDYPLLLEEQLDATTGSIVNEGKSGERTAEGLVRLTDLLAAGTYPQATTLLYWQGGNDLTDFIGNKDPFLLSSPGDDNYPFLDDLSTMLATVQSNVEAAIRAGREAGLEVFVATYFPLVEDAAVCDPLPLGILLPSQAANANDYITLLNQTLRRAASNAFALIVDVSARGSLLTSDTANYFNCNHLGEAGNEIVAGVFAQTVGPPTE